MHFLALATDYDGTLATDGRVDAATLAALKAFRHTGRKLIMVTGRELADLQRVFPELGVFDLVVAENGALLYEPGSHSEHLLGAAPPDVFLDRLREKRVAPMSVGRSIVATWQPHETIVAEAIRDLGLDLRVILNKGAVMVLPTGVDKASGLAAALHRLALGSECVVAAGDAENDLAFMRTCGLAVAVANALPSVKLEADLVTAHARSAGVVELMQLVCAKDDELLASERRGGEGRRTQA